MKTYKFTIHASPSERGAMEGFVTTYPMSTVYREEFDGTLENVGKRATMKIGMGQFRDAVELNAMRRLPCSISFKLEPRKGYKLATFEFIKG